MQSIFRVTPTVSVILQLIYPDELEKNNLHRRLQSGKTIGDNEKISNGGSIGDSCILSPTILKFLTTETAAVSTRTKRPAFAQNAVLHVKIPKK